MPDDIPPPAGAKTLYLLRHAEASRKKVDDFDRPLNKRGRAAAQGMGSYLAQQQIMPAQVLCSSARRTRETLEGLQEALGAVVPARFERGLYMADESALLRRVKGLNDSIASAMLIGHNPGLERLAVLLASEGEDNLLAELESKFPTGSLAVIATEVTHWADLEPGSGRLVSFVRARDLTAA